MAEEAGIELLTNGDWGFAQAAVHRDVSDTHDGYEVYQSRTARVIPLVMLRRC